MKEIYSSREMNQNRRETQREKSMDQPPPTLLNCCIIGPYLPSFTSHASSATPDQFIDQQCQTSCIILWK
jgi:hypothetical protein